MSVTPGESRSITHHESVWRGGAGERGSGSQARGSPLCRLTPFSVFFFSLVGSLVNQQQQQTDSGPRGRRDCNAFSL